MVKRDGTHVPVSWDEAWAIVDERLGQVADEWVAVRPGSDALLLAAIANTLFADGLADPGAHPTTEFGSTASWLIDVVNVLSGNLDRPGGSMFPTPVAGGATTRGKPGSGRGFTLGRGHSRMSTSSTSWSASTCI